MQYMPLARSKAVLHVLLHRYSISVNFVEVPIFSFNVIYFGLKMMQLSEAGKLLCNIRKELLSILVHQSHLNSKSPHLEAQGHKNVGLIWQSKKYTQQQKWNQVKWPCAGVQYFKTKKENRRPTWFLFRQHEEAEGCSRPRAKDREHEVGRWRWRGGEDEPDRRRRGRNQAAGPSRRTMTEGSSRHQPACRGGHAHCKVAFQLWRCDSSSPRRRRLMKIRGQWHNSVSAQSVRAVWRAAARRSGKHRQRTRLCREMRDFFSIKFKNFVSGLPYF